MDEERERLANEIAEEVTLCLKAGLSADNIIKYLQLMRTVVERNKIDDEVKH
jgi:hypothetical protein